MAGESGGIRIELFGGLRVSHGDAATARLPAQQTGALLALLALNLHRPCTREELAAALWPDVEAAEARRRLRQTLYRLTQQLATDLASDHEIFLQRSNDIRLDPDRFTSDVAEFERAVQSAQRSHNPSERARHLACAEALYQGELLPGFYLEAIVAEQHRLDCLFQKVLHDLVVARIETGETDVAANAARRAIDRDPISEEAHSLLMRVYAAQGKPQAVARQYEELERRLHEAFEEQPCAQIRELAASLETQASIRAAEPMTASITASNDLGAGLAQPACPALGEASLAPTVSPDEASTPDEASVTLAEAPDLGTDPNREPWRGRTAACTDVGAGLAPPACTPQLRLDSVTKPALMAPHIGSGLPVSAPPRPAILTVLSRRDAVGTAGVILALLLLLGVGARLTARLRRPTPALHTGSVFADPVPPTVRSAFRDYAPAVRTPTAVVVRPATADAAANPAIAGGHIPDRLTVVRRKTARANHGNVTAATAATRPTLPGMELWAQRCDLRPGYKNDATAILADPTGGVFVLGFVYTPKTDVDFLILKYNAAGKLLWTQTYDGPGHDCDRARSGAVDADGNLYVTGESDGGKGDGKGNHNCWDVATMKFDHHGKQLWVQRWAGPGNNADEPVKLCLDAHRNVFVTAKSNYGDPPESGFDWVTLKYDTNGKPLWDPPRRFGGPGDDEPTDMAVDRGGNVYVTGYEVVNGRSINRVAKVSQGKVIGDEPLDEVCQCVIVKYTSAGEQKWVRAYKATGYVSARPVGIALDRDGNVTMVATRHAPTISSLLVRKYNRDGRLLWERSCLLGVGQTGCAAGIVTDRAGRACVLATVNSGSTTTAEDLLTLLYDRDGTLLWSDTVDGAAHGCDNACAITAGRQGNFIVMGTVDNGRDEARFTAADYVTVKYAPNGKERWRRSYNGNLCHDDLARAVTVDGQGNVYVVGQSDPGHGRPYTIVTVKYAP